MKLFLQFSVLTIRSGFFYRAKMCPAKKNRILCIIQDLHRSRINRSKIEIKSERVKKNSRHVILQAAFDNKK